MIATTMEQSNRLIAVGLGEEYADMYYTLVGRGFYLSMARGDVPAWSLPCLWDIVHNLNKSYVFDTKMSSEELMELLVKTIESILKK